MFFNLQVLHQGIVVRVHSEQQGKALSIPQKAVVQETTESTKIRIDYDVSAWANEKAPSLNDCVETGPTLQNKLWSVLIRNRLQPEALAGDLKQAFLQVRIPEKDRDVMRFHLSKDLATKEVEPYDSHERYLVCPHTYIHTCFSLGLGLIDQHLDNLQHVYPNKVEGIRQSFCVDHLIGTERTMANA